MLFPSFYCGSIEYYTRIIQADEVVFDIHEHFIKQTFRSRCEILGPNGRQTLSIPVHRRNHTPMMDVEIDNSTGWNHEHWRALTTAYNSSPYFEEYTHLLKPLLSDPPDKLIQLNQALHLAICKCLGINHKFERSQSFTPYDENDLRVTLSPKKPSYMTFSEYIQVFSDKFPFEKGLSILGLIFNKGPESLFILKNQIINR